MDGGTEMALDLDGGGAERGRGREAALDGECKGGDAGRG